MRFPLLWFLLCGSSAFVLLADEASAARVAVDFMRSGIRVEILPDNTIIQTATWPRDLVDLSVLEDLTPAVITSLRAQSNRLRLDWPLSPEAQVFWHQDVVAAGGYLTDAKISYIELLGDGRVNAVVSGSTYGEDGGGVDGGFEAAHVFSSLDEFKHQNGIQSGLITEADFERQVLEFQALAKWEEKSGFRLKSLMELGLDRSVSKPPAFSNRNSSCGSVLWGDYL